MENYVKIKNLSVSEHLFKFINQEALPGTGVSQPLFWQKFDEAAHNLAIKALKMNYIPSNNIKTDASIAVSIFGKKIDIRVKLSHIRLGYTRF